MSDSKGNAARHREAISSELDSRGVSSNSNLNTRINNAHSTGAISSSTNRDMHNVRTESNSTVHSVSDRSNPHHNWNQKNNW